MRGDASTEGSQGQERELLPGRRDRALAPAVVETCATGTSTRKARRIAERMGVGRLSKDQAGAIARSLDADAAEPLGRDLSGYRMPYLWLDATCVRRLRGGRVASAMVCLVTDNRYGVCPSLLRDQRTILTVVGTARWLVFSLTPQGCLLLESPRAIPVTRGPAMT